MGTQHRTASLRSEDIATPSVPYQCLLLPITLVGTSLTSLVDTSPVALVCYRTTSVPTMDEQLPRANRIEIPDEHVVGVPADFASVWHTTESFVIDFLSVKAPEQLAEHEGQTVVMQDLVVNARIRMPPTHVIELMKALEQQLSLWETETGQRPPTEPLHPDLDG
jgi:hypothetical protein